MRAKYVEEARSRKVLPAEKAGPSPPDSVPAVTRDPPRRSRGNVFRLDDREIESC